MTLNAHARRQAQQQANELVGQTLQELTSLERRVLSALLARTAEGWHLLVRDQPAHQANAFLIGPGGVFAVLIAEQPPDERTATAVLRHAEERCADIRDPRGQVLTHSGIHHVVVIPGGGNAKSDHSRHWVLREQDLPRLFHRDAVHLNRRQVEGIVNQLATRLPGYGRLRVRLPERAPEAAGLLDERDITADQLSAAQQRPFDAWMTFLHPHQNVIVTRDYSGPARISGPAGTGKTIVALHRLRYLARRSVGPLLFTTFVRSLPPVHQRTFQRLAPELAARVEFVNLHAWIREFLRTRDRAVAVHPSKIDNAFSRAWLACRPLLENMEKSPHYWQTEIDRVIKGRGIRTFDEYAHVPRRGRSLRLDAGQRANVWQLYEEYQRNLTDKQLHDYNDMISLALAELAAAPIEVPYAAVVVDEVQDITLNGLRLLRKLGSDGPNRLLLIGDGQQQVYPGGWRLSDAGIPIQGRGEVLRVNYRNRAEVLGFAQRFDAMNQVDDLDGAAGVALRDAESANIGGEIKTWRGPEDRLPNALLEAVGALAVPRGHAALIVFHRRDLDRCTAILQQAGIPMLALEHYQGEHDDKLKVGTVHRAKGLEFQGVLAVHFTRHATASKSVEQEARDLQERQHLVAATRARDYLWWAIVEAT